MKQRSPFELAYYERLIFKTAAMYTPLVEDDFDDVQQVLRIKCWRALNTYDPQRSSMDVDKYVFMCLRNQVKDLLKRKKRNEAYIEDFRSDAKRNDIHEAQLSWFDARYLADDTAFDDVEEEPPLLPSTLSLLERKVVALLYANYTQIEAARRLEVPRGEVERAVRGIRTKMADWRPTVAEATAVAA